MTLLHAFAAILVYAVIAFLAASAGQQRAEHKGSLTVFPVLKLYRILVWSGGVACAVGGAQEVISEGFTFTGIFFSIISIGTVLLPLQSVVVSSEGVGSLPVLLAKGVIIPWNGILRVEHRTRGTLIVVVGVKGTVTHTRYNAEPELFESLLKAHVDKERWK